MRVAASKRMTGWLIGGSPAGWIASAAITLALALGMAVPAAAATAVSGVQLQPGSKMLVEADQLVYDYDHNTVSALGNVKIYYSGYTLEAERVTYNKPTRRLVASGKVKLTDPTGIATFAEQLDLTDDFSDGFVQSLRVEAPDRTRFAAERADRANGETTTFTNGVYTACEPCKDHPEKPPLWQVNAQKIIMNQKEKMIYFRNASFEFMGVPIAYVPYFSTADSTVKRKSGLLTPIFGYSSARGFSLTTPYFLALAPNYDMTISPSYYTKQGFMGDLEWRHRLSNGQYTVHVAGISQNDPGAFLASDGSGTYAQRDFRGGVRTTGEFAINSMWSFGWDGTLSTDRTFTRNYSVLNADTAVTQSNIHLTGIGESSYFDIRAMHFEILTDSPSNPIYDQGRQGDALPVADYSRVFDDPVLGGQFTLTSNLTNITRSENDPFTVDMNGDGIIAGNETFYHGVAGNYTRYSTQLDWERKIIGPFGQVFTPFAYLRGDAFAINPDSSAPASLTDQSSGFRGMPAVGMEWSWPVMAQIGQSTQVLEPIAQVIIRPNETLAGQLPNEDAQSLVWDDSLLFAHDKFSGYDRVEGGTRLNAGLHYLGTFSNGMSVDGLFGQSFQLAGANPFASADIADAGNFSGLETKDSDYVGRLALDTGLGPRLSAHGRFDNQDFTLNRAQVEATNVIGPVTASASYLYLRNYPNAGVTVASSAAAAAASINFIQNWRLFGTVSYDLTKSSVASDSLGVAFDNGCLTLSLAYSEVLEAYTDLATTRQLTFRLSLRTLGDTGGTASLGKSGS